MTITDAWQSLEADLLGPEPDYDTEPSVELDRETADRYLRRVAHLDAQYEADKEVAEAEIERVRAWLVGRYETYNAQRGWLHGVLRRFHEAVLTRDPRAKTFGLPAGKLKMRVQQPSWTIDPDVYRPWAQEHAADTLRIPEPTIAIDANAVKRTFTVLDDGRVVTADGELVPGVTVELRDPKFSIEVGGDADSKF